MSIIDNATPEEWDHASRLVQLCKLELGQKIDIHYLLSNKKFTDGKVVEIFHSTICVEFAGVNHPLYFPNPLSPNMLAEATNEQLAQHTFTIREGTDVKPTYLYKVYPRG